KEEGWLRVVHTETGGKAIVERCVISEKGLEYLLGQVSPKHVLEDFVRALETRQNQVGQLLSAAHQTQASVNALRAAAEKVLSQIELAQGTPAGSAEYTRGRWTNVVLDHLVKWQDIRTTEDCPLPELYHHAEQAAPGLTIGRFHDGLRHLNDEEQIYLHPW